MALDQMPAQLQNLQKHFLNLKSTFKITWNSHGPANKGPIHPIGLYKHALNDCIVPRTDYRCIKAESSRFYLAEELQTNTSGHQNLSTIPRET